MPWQSWQFPAGQPLSLTELHWLTAGDHDQTLKSSGFNQQQHLLSAADAIAAFLCR
jgi:predicted alpha/beta-hydrolase family hydrolase